MQNRELSLNLMFLLFLWGTILYGGEIIIADTIQPPATYHLSFDTMDFLRDDIATKYDEPTIEQRNLRLVPGKYGKGLYNATVFSREDLEKTSMSTWDLDPLLEVLVHHRFGYWKQYKTGHMEPYIWGTGRLKGESGCVAFWAKGTRVFPGYLFAQGSSSFGRYEQYLIAIVLNEDKTLEAYVRDARYQYHRIKTKPVWDESRFNHVALIWDRSQGLALFVDGVESASSWGNDAWWTTQIPGLFHMPMCGFTYDELWIFDRPLKIAEIKRLMNRNQPPQDAKLPEPPYKEAAERLGESFIGNDVSGLPAVRPSDGEKHLTFREIFPEWAGDGCVGAPFVMDGKYELAWPQDYTSFTNILGDSDFHPEKVNIKLPEGSTINYFTVEGNLADAKMLAGGASGDKNMVEVFTVKDDMQLFYGVLTKPISCDNFRIPFLKGYGSPPGYKPGLNLALTGGIRIHEVGFFNVREEPIGKTNGTIRCLELDSNGSIPSDTRCGYAMRALNDMRNSRVLALGEENRGGSQWIAPGNFTRINLLSEPWSKAESVTSLVLDLKLRKAAGNDYVILALHDPGAPARIWTKVVFRLEDFSGGKGELCVKLDFTDIKMAPGDRLWLDVAFSGSEEILAGGKGGSIVLVETDTLVGGDGRYAEKALKPALADFTKIYYWYYPWKAMRDIPDYEKPVTFGGFYDIVTYPLTVARTEPDNFTANVILELSMIRNPFVTPGSLLNALSISDSLRDRGFTVEGFEQKSRDSSPELWPPVRHTPNDGSPEWAFYMNYYLSRYKDIVDWWAERQNPDGQVGGGWNDDVLFASRLPGVFLYTGDRKARGIFNRIFEGLEWTRMFHDGYCNIDPMDYIHVEDLVRNRYEGLLFEPGDPNKMKISMRTAWRLDKPDKTPVNYINGKSFQYDNDFLLWYWGETPAYPAYTVKRENVTAKMKEIAPAMDEVILFRYTEAGMFTDGSYMPGCYDIKRIQIGGGWGPWIKNISLAVSWEKGGGQEIPKWVESATDTSFVAHLYSYDMVEQEATARLYRIKKGIYRVTLAYEGKDESKGTIVNRIEELTRFSSVTVPVRPGRELVLKIQCVRLLTDTGPLPDLAVSDAVRDGSRIRAVVYNFGSAPVNSFNVSLSDQMGLVREKRLVENLGSARDFVPKQAEVSFSIPAGEAGIFRIIVDPDNMVEEIIEENNRIEISVN